jgi:hypothetical protein
LPNCVSGFILFFARGCKACWAAIDADRARTEEWRSLQLREHVRPNHIGPARTDASLSRLRHRRLMVMGETSGPCPGRSASDATFMVGAAESRQRPRSASGRPPGMEHPRQATRPLPTQPRLALFEPAKPPDPAGVRWLINGFPANLLIWTAEQWADLNERPSDAQYHPNGVWCALRME